MKSPHRDRERERRRRARVGRECALQAQRARRERRQRERLLQARTVTVCGLEGDEPLVVVVDAEVRAEDRVAEQRAEEAVRLFGVPRHADVGRGIDEVALVRLRPQQDLRIQIAVQHAGLEHLRRRTIEAGDCRTAVDLVGIRHGAAELPPHAVVHRQLRVYTPLVLSEEAADVLFLAAERRAEPVIQRLLVEEVVATCRADAPHEERVKRLGGW